MITKCEIDRRQYYSPCESNTGQFKLQMLNKVTNNMCGLRTEKICTEIFTNCEYLSFILRLVLSLTIHPHQDQDGVCVQLQQDINLLLINII